MIAVNTYRCYAWALMDNHYHLAIRMSDVPLGIPMRRLNSKYARYHGKRHGRRGYLFQERFKSIATQDQGYIERLIRYIHLNPLRAGICKSPRQLRRYPWCGHGVLLGVASCSFQHTTDVLRRFGKTIADARESYERFIREGWEGGADIDFIEILRRSNKENRDRHDPACWVIGDPEFVKKAIQTDKENKLRIPYYRQKGLTLDDLTRLVAQELDIDSSEIAKRGHGNLRARARKIFCYLGVRELGFAAKDVAQYLRITNAAVSQALDAGEKMAAESKIQIIK
jgi:hypothetical protein